MEFLGFLFIELIMNIFFKKFLSVLICIGLFPCAAIYCEQTDSKGFIPASIGSVTHNDNTDIPTENRLIIHILDSHCNYEAQENISQIIKYIIKNNDIKLIGIEGASGDVNTKIFASFPDNNTKHYVCKNFLKNGFLTGAENFSICSNIDNNISLWGLEDIATYYTNLDTFKNTIKTSEQTLNEINNLVKLTDTLKNKIYPEKFLFFDSKKKQYLSHKLDLTHWIHILEKSARENNVPLSDYRNIKKFNNLISLEKKTIDYSKITLEKNNLLNNLKDQLSETEFKKIINNNLNFFLGNISEDEHIALISKYINKQDYPNLQSLSLLKKLQNSLDKNILSGEIKELTNLVKESILNTIKIKLNKADFLNLKTIDQISETLYLYEKLTTLSITDKEYLSYEKLSKKYPLNKIITILYSLTEKNNSQTSILSEKAINQINTSINLAEKFYTVSDKRSKIMINNLINKMDEDQLEKSILITGGFHSRSIQNELRHRNISFITIKPTITNLNNKTYSNLMQQDIIGLNSTLFLNAANLAFPVLCDLSIARGSYFADLRHKFAADLFAANPVPIAEHQKLIGDDLSKKLFDNLLELAGITTPKTPKSAQSTAVSDINPESIVEKILTYSNEKINTEIQSMGIDAQEIGAAEKEVFINYLFELLDLSISITPSLKKTIDYYLEIVKATNYPQKSVLHDIAVYKSQLILTKNIAYNVIQDMEKNNVVEIEDNFSTQNINIESIFSLPLRDDGTTVDYINFNMTFVSKDGIKKSFFVKSITNMEFEKNGNFAMDAFDRQRTNNYFVDMPHGKFKGYQVSEKIGDLNFSEVDVLDDNIDLYAELLGEAVAEAYAIGLHDRHDDNLRVIMNNGKPQSIINIDLHTALSTKYSITASLLSIIELILKAQGKDLTSMKIENIVTAFLNGYTKTIKQLQKYYIDKHEFLEKYPYLKENPSWDIVLNRLNPKTFSLDSHVKNILDYINKRTKQNIQYIPSEISKIKFDLNNLEKPLTDIPAIFPSNQTVYDAKSLMQTDEERYLLDQLALISGINADQQNSVTVNAMLSNVSPGKVTDFLSKLTVASVDNIMLKNGFSSENLNDKNRKIFIKHLLKLLDITIKLSVPEVDKKYHLAILMKTYQDKNKPLLAETVKEQLYEEFFKDTDTITQKLSKIIGGKTHNVAFEKSILNFLNSFSGIIYRLDNVWPKTLRHPLKAILATIKWVKKAHLNRLRSAKMSGAKEYDTLKTQVNNLAEQTGADLTDLSSDIDTLIFLLKKINLNVGQNITINQGMFEALDLRFLSENQYLPVMKKAYLSKYNRAFYTNRKDGKNNLHAMKSMANMLDSIPDEILENFPKWANTFFISDENERFHGYGSFRGIFINSYPPRLNSSNAKVIYHEYIGHVLLNTLINQALIKNDFSSLEQRLSVKDILNIVSACINTEYANIQTVRFSLDISGENIDQIKIPFNELQELITDFNVNHPKRPQIKISQKITPLNSSIKLKNMSYDFLQWAGQNNHKLFWFLVKHDFYFDDTHLIREYPSESFFGVSRLTKINELIARAVETNDITAKNMFFSYDLIAVSEILARRFTKGFTWTYSNGWRNLNTTLQTSNSNQKQVPVTFVDEQPAQIPVSSGETDIKTLQNFINRNNFTSFTPDNTNTSAQLFNSGEGNFFLKNFPQSIYSAATIKRKILNWRANPIGIITYLLRLFTTPIKITKSVQERIGDIVPPMLSLDKFINKLIQIEDKIYQITPNAHIQQKMPYLVKDVFERLTSANDINGINAVIDQYFQIQQTMWQRGFFDMDYFFYKNYGVQHPDSLNMKCIDINEFTTNKAAAIFLMKFDRLYYGRLLRDLRTQIPEECVQYFDDRYKHIFTVDNFLTQWKTGTSVPANNISLFFTEKNENKKDKNQAQHDKQNDIEITSFLNEIGIEDSKGILSAKINELYNNFYIQGNTSIKSIRDILGTDIDESEFKKLCLEVFNLETQVVIPLKKMIVSFDKNGHNHSGLFFMAVYKLVNDHIESAGQQRPTRLTDRLRSYQDIFAQSL